MEEVMGTTMVVDFLGRVEEKTKMLFKTFLKTFQKITIVGYFLLKKNITPPHYGTDMQTWEYRT